MKQITQFENKKVFVLGLAKSGYHAAKLLVDLGATVVVNDGKTPEDLADVNELKTLGITVFTGSHPVDLLDESFDYMIKNPGIPYTNTMVEKAKLLNIPILTDVELAYLIAKADIISVTGTNGKTTTTTLIAEMLKNNLKNGHAYVAGNIGVPATTVARESQEHDTIIMEMSSFQLMGIDQFKPHIAVITNIYSAHLDYHGNREEYVKAKLNLLKRQCKEDHLILNKDLNESQEIAKKSQATVHYFSKYDKTADAHLDGKDIIVLGEKLLSVDDIHVPGEHNVENVLAAALASKIYGQTNDAIREAVQQFKGVIHRSQFVKDINGRRFYNDSKATNILATQMALKGFTKDVILIAGGLDRGNDFDDLIPDLKPVKIMVLYGETKEKLAQAAMLADVHVVFQVDTLEEAVQQAYKNSQAGDTILFSPACASWDQFPNFEVRGEVFMAAVEQLN